MATWKGGYDVSQGDKAIISNHDINRPYGEFDGKPSSLKNLTYSANSPETILLWCMMRAYNMGAKLDKPIHIYLEVGLAQDGKDYADEKQTIERNISAFDFAHFITSWGFLRQY